MADDKRERVLAAAFQVFLKYGFKRVTMNDLADAAGISRPALYLVFKNKEEVFTASIERRTEENAAHIAAKLSEHTTPLAKLHFVFDTWAIRSFERVVQSPEARELLDAQLDFARDAQDKNYARLESILSPIIAGMPKAMQPKGVTPHETAHVLASSVRGYKRFCTSARELERLINGLLALTFRTAS